MKSATTIVAGLLTVGNLFALKPAPKTYQVDWNVKLPAPVPEPAKPSIVCGMTVIPADPAVDPRMRVAPSDRGTAFTMRVVPPTVCAPK